MNDESEKKEDVVSLDDLDLSLDAPLSKPVVVSKPTPAPAAASETTPAAELKSPDSEAHLETFLAEKAPDLIIENPEDFSKPREPEAPSKALLFLKEIFAKLKRLATNPKDVFRRRSLKYSELLKEWGEGTKVQAKAFLGYLNKDALRDLKILGKEIVRRFKEIFSFVWNLSRLKKFYIVTFIVSSFGLTKIAQRFSMKNPLPRIGNLEVTSLGQVANRVYDFDSKSATWEEFESTVRLPNHTVTLNKIVVNLRMSEKTSVNPMGYLRLSLETSNKDSAIEVLDREKEIADLVQRTVEEMPYDIVNTTEGKNLMKIKVRMKLNEVLNRGRVKRVYIQEIILKR
ncbi:MAG: flagellar basal body-associated FliL family protein [Pseudomonadota bacterium]|nr:flagellar basal body-associated FliL family protein [Pseudomonadota bacterium]